MTASRPSWEALNAYIDGELSPREAAAVAEALAADHTLAARVATLSRLKASTEDMLEPDAARTMIRLLDARRTRPRGLTSRPLMLTASLVLMLVLIGAVCFAPFGRSGDPVRLADSWRLHQDWAAETADRHGEGVAAVSVLTALDGFGPNAFLPDLSASRLELARVETRSLPQDRGSVFHAGYVGTRGCRVSFMILAAPGALPTAFTRYERPEGWIYAWQSGPYAYLLMAAGMDPERLELIANKVHDAVQDHRPFGPRTHTALRRSREASEPCQT